MLVRKRKNSEDDISHMGPYPVKGDLKENDQGPRDISPENAREGLSPVVTRVLFPLRITVSEVWESGLPSLPRLSDWVQTIQTMDINARFRVSQAVESADRKAQH